jgi:hypothetical protein
MEKVERSIVLSTMPFIRSVLARHQEVERQFADEDDADTGRLYDPPGAEPLAQVAASPIYRAACDDTAEARVETLASAFARWGAALGAPEWIVVPYLHAPWHVSANDHPPAARAIAFLGRHGIDADYTGGLRLTTAETPAWIAALSWIVRCCPEMPFLAISPPALPLVVTLCQYVNLHCEIYDDACAGRAATAATQAGLVALGEARCAEADDAIAGRRVILMDAP